MLSESEHIFPPQLVRASAGTGKTFSLTNRFIALITAGEEPDRVLATTFTRKAAGEIQQRILSRLAEAVLEPDKARDLAKFIVKDNFSTSDAASALEQIIARQHRLQICTLDSFCAQVVGAFALELGLLPGWRVGDQFELDRIRHLALQNFIASESVELLVELRRLVDSGEARRSVYQQLVKELTELTELSLETTPEAWNWLKVPPAQEKAQIKKALEEISTLELPATAKGEPHKGWQSAVLKLIQQVKDENWNELIKGGLAEKILHNEEKFHRKAISSKFIRACKPILNQARHVLLGRLQEQSKALYQIMTRYREVLFKTKHEAQLLEFNDVKYLLSQAAIMDDLQKIYFRLDTRYRHLLLDEFQDTSGAEWQVLDPLADEILSQSGFEQSFFCVGDVKQAIYGWRGGVAEIFDTLSERWPQLCAEKLDKSYRSSPVIINFINKVFSKISDNPALAECREAILPWERGFNEHSSAFPELKGEVTLLLAPEEEQESEDDKDREESSLSAFNEASKIVKKLFHKAPQASIAVLVRTNRAVGQIINRLAKDDIKASGEGGNLLIDSQAVLILLSFLKLVDHPGDKIAAYHVGRSPLAEHLKISEFSSLDQIILAGLKFRKDVVRSSFSQQLTRLVDYLSPYFTAHDQYRMTQLLDLSHQYPESLMTRFSNFIDFIHSKKVEDQNASRVRVMTIHQAKGLEFDVVILPELNRHFTNTQTPKVLLGRESPFAPITKVVAYPAKHIRALDSELDKLYKDAEALKLREELSVLYVALSRAKHALYLIFEKLHDKYPLSAEGVLQAAFSDSPFKSEGYFSEGESAWVDSLQSSDSELADNKAPKAITLKEEGVIKYRNLKRRQASKLKGCAFSQGISAKLSNKQGTKAATRGTVLHSLLELVGWIEDGLPKDEMLQKKLAEHHLFADEGRVILKEFSEIISKGNLKRLLSKDNYLSDRITDIAYKNEYPFAFRQGDELYSGIIDRIVFSYCDDKLIECEIIDYKSDRAPEDSGAQREWAKQKLTDYEPQLTLYRNALSGMTGLSLDKIKAKLFMLDIDLSVCYQVGTECHLL